MTFLRQFIPALAICFVTAGLLAGCANTVDGAGQDIEQMGESVQETVDE